MESLRQVPVEFQWSAMRNLTTSSHVGFSARLQNRYCHDSLALACTALPSDLFHPNLHPIPKPSPCSPAANAFPPPPISLTRGIGSVLLDSGPLAVEGVVGRALKALRGAGVEAAGSGVAENGERRRGARGGAEAEHCVVGIAGCGGSGDVVRGCAGSSLRASWTFARLTASDSAGVECLRNSMTSQRRWACCDGSFAGSGDAAFDHILSSEHQSLATNNSHTSWTRHV
jgi:hypothetical protein